MVQLRMDVQGMTRMEIVEKVQGRIALQYAILALFPLAWFFEINTG